MELQIEEFDSKIREVVSKKAVLEVIATGFGFTEGPVWCGDYLLFTDIPESRILRLQIKNSKPEITTYRFPSNNANGLTLDKKGCLIACERSTHRVTRTEADGSITVLADSYKGQPLNMPNDVVVRSKGDIFFTDVDPGRVYRIAPDGEVTLLAGDFDMSNGLAFSPDETILYVNDTRRKHIRAFDVNPDGSISNDRVFVEMKLPEPGAPDGMKVDIKGNVYCSGPGGIWIMEPGGKAMGRFFTPEVVDNFAWGDLDWKTLYITARASLYRVKLAVPGIAVG